jgi:ABC-type sugar transport system substrate-binding protein
MSRSSAARRGSRRLGLTALLATVVCTAAVGCGSSGDTSSNSSSAGASSAGSAPDASVAKAEATVKPYLSPPASIGNTVPLSKKPPTGKKVVALSCTLDVCASWRSYVVDAAKALGWTATGVGFDGTPEDTLKKVEQAVSQKPDGIIINGVPRSTYEAAANTAKAANVPIVTQMGELQGAATPPFIAVQYQAPQFDKMSEVTGNWVIADSKGKANALLLAYANFPLSERITDTTKKTIDDNCSDCTTKKLRVQAADTGTKLPSAVVSEIQRNPKINYVVLQDGAMAAGLDAALREAGLTDKVRVLGNDLNQDVAQSTINGDQLGWMSFSNRAAAFQGIDALARNLVGDKQQENIPLMNQIFTKSELGAKPDENVWQNLPTDLAQQYQKLWLVG